MSDNRDDKAYWDSFFSGDEDAGRDLSWLSELERRQTEAGFNAPLPGKPLFDDEAGPEPVLEPVLEPAFEPEPAAEPEPEPVFEPERAPEPEPEPEPEFVPEPEPEPQPEPEPEPVRAAEGAESGFADSALIPSKRRHEKPAKREPMPIFPEEPDEEPDADAPTARDYLPIRFSRRGRSGCLGGMMYAVFLICLSIIGACFLWMCASDVLALGKTPTTATVTAAAYEGEPVIEETDEGVEDVTPLVDIDQVSAALKDAGMIDYRFLFKLYAAVSHADRKIDPGTYSLSTELDYRALVKNMQSGGGAQEIVELTFPEGWTMAQIFELMAAEGVATTDELYEAAAHYNYSFSFLDETKYGDADRLEGFLFPDTYEFYVNEQASSAVYKLLKNFNNRDTSDMLYTTDQRGMTVAEIVTIASMIEAEAADDSERANIASVIYNRLSSGMLLQIDATVMFALGEHKSYVTDADLTVDSLYNTYLNYGLPPGAISNPGLASINAAITPNSTGYFYYALDTATGTHRFFSNKAEFDSFVETQDYTQQ